MAGVFQMFVSLLTIAALPQAWSISGIARKEVMSHSPSSAVVTRLLEVNGRAVVKQGLRKEPTKATDDVGGSPSKNAFSGEEDFLRDASESVHHAKEVAAAMASLGEKRVELLDADTSEKKADHESGRNAFAAEEAFLNSVASDKPREIVWARRGHDNQCVCGTGTKQPLSMGDCQHDNTLCQFVLPSRDTEQFFGQIKWAHDKTQCMSVKGGNIGNGNNIILEKCSDDFQPMNFTIFTPWTSKQSAGFWTPDSEESSGSSVICWAKQPWMQPGKCLDVNRKYSDLLNLKGHEVVLWDGASGALWEFADVQ